jgi:hypothetical protein
MRNAGFKCKINPFLESSMLAPSEGPGRANFLRNKSNQIKRHPMVSSSPMSQPHVKQSSHIRPLKLKLKSSSYVS